MSAVWCMWTKTRTRVATAFLAGLFVVASCDHKTKDPVESRQSLSRTEHRLFLAPVGDAKRELIAELATALQSELCIPVEVREIGFSSSLREELKAPGQVDADMILDDMWSRIYKKDHEGYLAVTSKDLRAPGLRFCFGLSTNDGVAVLSYARFETNATHDLLLERTLKQALSSTGLMFDLPRCEDQLCARAFPNSVYEHDLKGALCEVCKRQFDDLFHSD